MPKPIKCPQCGASEANLLQNDIYQCKFCGSIYEFGDVKDDFDKSIFKHKPSKQDIPSTTSTNTSSTITQIILWAFLFFLISIGISLYFTLRVKNKPFALSSFKTERSSFYDNNNESTNYFTFVTTNSGAKVWTISRVNANDLSTVNYYINELNLAEKKVEKSFQLGKTISWKQSNDDAYRISFFQAIGDTCWLIYGSNLIAYDANTFTEVLNNETLKRKNAILKSGIAEIEKNHNGEGFKITTKDGYKFIYYLSNKSIVAEKQSTESTVKNEATFDVTEYYFTTAERQQLYRVKRKVSAINPSIFHESSLTSMLSDNSDWYRRVYKINSVEEVKKGSVFFNAAVLYSTNDKIVAVYQKELGDSASIYLTCFDTNGNERWTKNDMETAYIKPFLQSTNAICALNGKELVMMQAYQSIICLDIDKGIVLWKFKPY